MSLSFHHINRVNQAVHDAPAVEKCPTCGGYIGDYGPRYARHHDACECVPCNLCRAPILKDDYRTRDFVTGMEVCTFCYEDVQSDMKTAQEANDDPEVFTYA